MDKKLPFSFGRVSDLDMVEQTIHLMAGISVTMTLQ